MENAALPGYPGTRGLNFWKADPALSLAAGARLSGQGLERCSEFGAFVGGPFDALVEVIRRPFDERPGLERYAAGAPDGSGPYTTFCGT